MIQTITPIDNTIYVEREYSSKIIEETISNSVIAQKEWSLLKVSERVELLKKFVTDFLSKEKQILEEITRQMGRPISQASSELKGFKLQFLDQRQNVLKCFLSDHRDFGRLEHLIHLMNAAAAFF